MSPLDGYPGRVTRRSFLYEPLVLIHTRTPRLAGINVGGARRAGTPRGLKTVSGAILRGNHLTIKGFTTRRFEPNCIHHSSLGA